MGRPLPSHARVVIIGGGVAGCSVAYHLAELGWKDIVLLERKQLSCGTTWHAAGLLGQLRATANMTKLAKYSIDLYKRLPEETGQDIGLRQNGSLGIAPSEARFEEFARGAAMGRCYGVDIEVVTPSEIRDLYPIVNTDDLVGGVFIPSDGQCNPADLTQALAKGARMRGASIFEGIKVTAIHQKNGAVSGVSTDQGDIACDYIVNCSGMWGHEVGSMAGVTTPLHACEHFYIVTEPMETLPKNAPVLRDPDACAYFKEDAGKILLGCFEPVAKPWAMDGIPEDFCFDELPEDFDHFAPILESAIHRMPALETAGIRTFFNGPESFTPDDRYLLGEAPEVRNFFMACGFNSIGIQSSGGAGKALAEWMDAGYPPFDLSDVDIRRMEPFQHNRTYLYNRAVEGLGLLYQMHWPYRQYDTARHVRRSPLHEQLKARGACFGETAGWERPNWFAKEGMEPVYDYSYGRQNWFDCRAEEHNAVRNNVGVFDLSTFVKIRVEGPDACDYLQMICANDVDVPVGKIVYTQWLNDRAGIEADLTVTRLADDVFLIVSGAAQRTRDLAWLRRHKPEDASLTITDVTSGEAVIAVMGPKSRDLLLSINPKLDLSNEGFRFATIKHIDLDMVPVRAHRITYVGELGWELYVPAEYAACLFEVIADRLEAYGGRLAGLHALDSLRLEKAFRHWGHDVSDEDTAHEAVLGFAVKLDKAEGKYGPFIGREAHRAQKEAGVPHKRLVQFKLDDPEPLLYHAEPIWMNGKRVGYLTSGNYGHYLGASMGMGYINLDEPVTKTLIDSATFEIEVSTEKFSAKAQLSAFYDPKSERLK